MNPIKGHVTLGSFGANGLTLFVRYPIQLDKLSPSDGCQEQLCLDLFAEWYQKGDNGLSNVH